VIVSINQPAYLPWLGYFHRIAVSDLHIVLDHVQFEKNSFTNRNKLRTKEGWCWLTVPLRTKGLFGELNLNRVEIAPGTLWPGKHAATMRQLYAKTPHFDEHWPFFAGVYEHGWERFSELANELTRYLLQAFGIETPLILSSEIEAEGAKDELVLSLCQAVEARTYLSGPLGRDYLREELFVDAGIEVRYDDYSHPVYSQAYDGFEPYMAAVDLLFNHGPDSRAILLGEKIG
jgi:hypothetical protein